MVFYHGNTFDNTKGTHAFTILVESTNTHFYGGTEAFW